MINVKKPALNGLFPVDLPPPQPTELDEPEPEAAPGEPNTLPDQPRPEPASQQVGKVSTVCFESSLPPPLVSAAFLFSWTISSVCNADADVFDIRMGKQIYQVSKPLS